jgi:hypothetical protein
MVTLYNLKISSSGDRLRASPGRCGSWRDLRYYIHVPTYNIIIKKEGFLKWYELVLIPIGKHLIGDSKGIETEMQERFRFVPVQIRRSTEGTPKEPLRNSEASKEH